MSPRKPRPPVAEQGASRAYREGRLQEPGEPAPLTGAALAWTWAVAVAAGGAWGFGFALETLTSGPVMIAGRLVFLAGIALNAFAAYELRSTYTLGRTRASRVVRVGILIAFLLVWAAVIVVGSWRFGWHGIETAVVAALVGWALWVAGLVVTYASTPRRVG